MTVAILGLGLIGGSLGLALRSGRGSERVIGFDRNDRDLALALERGAIDAPAASPAEAVREADLVVLATPVLAVRGLLAEVASALRPGAIVTDVASTKAQVMAWATALLPPAVTFIGGHPMAGSEKSGMAAARSNLFRGAVYCVTPPPHAPAEAVARVEQLAADVGARALRIAAADHDAAVAAVSHLPFLASIALVQETTGDARWDVWGEIAATGYRDVTRLASGDPAMYRDICVTNAAPIGAMLRGMADRLHDLADHLEDSAFLEQALVEARTAREAWLRSSGRFQLP